MISERRPNKLLLLVGSNPLPNYIAGVCLEPQEVVLLYSPETVRQRDYLRDALKTQSTELLIWEVPVDDATDARKIEDVCLSVGVDHLHYSGGTKPMAAHALRTLQLGEHQASYLDERRGLLRFDDGYDRSLEQYDLGLTLDLVLRLHGVERLPGKGEGPTSEDAAKVAGEVLPDPAKAHGSNGGWLERWTADQIESALGQMMPTIQTGVHCRRTYPPENGLPPTEFEIDVALVRGHRMHVVSCTTSSNWKGACKRRLFEVALRARHMGGDLARSALVCLLDGGDNKGPFVEQLRSHMASVWDAPNPPAVFGLTDLREWAGTSGSPNLGTLREWLNR